MSFHKELKDDITYQKWIGFIYDFFSCYDDKKDIYLHLPCSGGYYDQDDIFWIIWQTIRSEYFNLMKDKKFLQELENRRADLRKKNG